LPNVRYPLEYNPSPWNRAEAWLEYAEVYRDAVRVLLSWIKKNQGGYHDYQILPLLFLFRHYLELQLKGMILQRGGTFRPKEHSLSQLLKLIKLYDTNGYLVESPLIIRQLSALDERSDVFRYPEDTKGKRYFQQTTVPIYEELTKLFSLSQIIIVTVNELENLEGYFDAVRENQEQASENLD
jgi:HEPN domain-containing protein